MKRRLAILGSTGSIGVNALKVISALKGQFEITGLSGYSNISLLARQASVFKPKIVSIGNERLAGDLKRMLPAGIKVLSGLESLEEIVSRSDVDTVLFAISGNSCILPLITAIENKKKVALANKEALISAGSIIMEKARQKGVTIIPVDSEHNAIFQCLDGKNERPRRIYLTGSGGPLLNVPAERFDKLSKRFILKHPKWKMGKKISVDSATMMNKGLEIIEAHYLFGVEEEAIEVLIHPEAIVHSMVEFIDGTLLGELSVPDMRIPIEYALTYPERERLVSKRLDLAKIRNLSFFEPDAKKFPCLGLAREAARRGGTSGAVLSASDEEAVNMYLEGRIKFSDIARTILKTLESHSVVRDPEISDILEAGSWAREKARELCCH